METARSADGTVIAYDRTGDGPALIVSVGAFCTRQTFVAPGALRQRFTVVTYDRRGRGDSGDTQPFTPEREYEDRRGRPSPARTDVSVRGTKKSAWGVWLVASLGLVLVLGHTPVRSVALPLVTGCGPYFHLRGASVLRPKCPGALWWQSSPVR